MAIDDARASAEHLLRLEGVVGVGEGMTSDGDPSIVVMVTSRAVAPLSEIPSEIGGFPIEVIETGMISAESGGAGSEVDESDGDESDAASIQPL